MTAVSGPTLYRHQLGRILRAARERSGLSLDDVAKALDTSWSTVQRIESGGSARLDGPRLRALMDALRITDEDQREEIRELVISARQPAWWYPHTSALRRSFSLYLQYETEATVVRTVATVIIPGLLQTEAYTRAVMRRVDTGTAVSRVAVRLERQARLRKGDLHLDAILDEGCLRRIVGDQEVQREQFRYLVEMTGLPNVTLRIVPFSAGAYTTTLGALSLLELRSGETVACVELAGGDLFPEAEQYLEIYEDIERRALSMCDSEGMLQELLKELR